MAYKENKETLSVDVDKDVFGAFQKQWKARKQYKNDAVEAAISLWIALPTEVQAKLLAKELDANSLVQLVQEIVDQRIEAGRKAGLKLVGPPPHKPTRKG